MTPQTSLPPAKYPNWNMVVATALAAGFAAPTLPTVLRALEARLAAHPEESTKQAVTHFLRHPPEIMKGVIPYAQRQALSSGFGYPLVWLLNSTVYKDLPIEQKAVSTGITAALAEAFFLGPKELQELAAKYNKSHVPINMFSDTIIKGSVCRSSWGWGLGALVAACSDLYDLSQSQGSALGLAAGVTAGWISTPANKAMGYSVAHEVPYFTALRKVAEGGVNQAFRGWWTRSGAIGTFGMVAMFVKGAFAFNAEEQVPSSAMKLPKEGMVSVKENVTGR